jgi:Fe2+ or Zn2+ uptake regulation protein
MPTAELDENLRLVADWQRRAVLRYLRQSGGCSATVEALTSHLTDEIGRLEREPVATALVYVHLPKLADEGFIEYDRRSDAVRYRAGPKVETLLDRLPEDYTTASA